MFPHFLGDKPMKAKYNPDMITHITLGDKPLTEPYTIRISFPIFFERIYFVDLFECLEGSWTSGPPKSLDEPFDNEY